MIHPQTELAFISNEIGYGVVATSLLKKGTITWVLDKLDREFTPGQVHQLEPIFQNILEKYSFRNNRGNHVLCWDNARFVNHSFKSNCLTTAYDFEIAIRDIHPGEQLTDDYGYLNVSTPFEALDEGTRRKIVYPDDLLRYAHIWDRQLLSAFKEIPKVEQKLRSLLSDDMWQRSLDIAAGNLRMDSIRTCFYHPGKAEQ